MISVKNTAELITLLTYVKVLDGGEVFGTFVDVDWQEIFRGGFPGRFPSQAPLHLEIPQLLNAGAAAHRRTPALHLRQLVLSMPHVNNRQMSSSTVQHIRR